MLWLWRHEKVDTMIAYWDKSLRPSSCKSINVTSLPCSSSKKAMTSSTSGISPNLNKFFFLRRSSPPRPQTTPFSGLVTSFSGYGSSPLYKSVSLTNFSFSLSIFSSSLTTKSFSSDSSACSAKSSFSIYKVVCFAFSFSSFLYSS